MIFGKGYLINLIGRQGRTIKGKFLKLLLAAAPHHTQAMRKLIKFRMGTTKGLLPQEALNHTLQLGAGNMNHVGSFVIGEAFGIILVMDYWPHGLAAHGSGAHQGHIHAQAVAEGICSQITQGRFLNAWDA